MKMCDWRGVSGASSVSHGWETRSSTVIRECGSTHSNLKDLHNIYLVHSEPFPNGRDETSRLTMTSHQNHALEKYYILNQNHAIILVRPNINCWVIKLANLRNIAQIIQFPVKTTYQHILQGINKCQVGYSHSHTPFRILHYHPNTFSHRKMHKYNNYKSVKIYYMMLWWVIMTDKIPTFLEPWTSRYASWMVKTGFGAWPLD